MLKKKESYSDHWNKQGEYGKERIYRMIERKKKRHEKRSSRSRGFTCEMGYFECERRGYCNGDC